MGPTWGRQDPDGPHGPSYLGYVPFILDWPAQTQPATMTWYAWPPAGLNCDMINVILKTMFCVPQVGATLHRHIHIMCAKVRISSSICHKFPLFDKAQALPYHYAQDYFVHDLYIGTISNQSPRQMQGKHEWVLMVLCSYINQFLQ